MKENERERKCEAELMEIWRAVDGSLQGLKRIHMKWRAWEMKGTRWREREKKERRWVLSKVNETDKERLEERSEGLRKECNQTEWAASITRLTKVFVRATKAEDNPAHSEQHAASTHVWIKEFKLLMEAGPNTKIQCVGQEWCGQAAEFWIYWSLFSTVDDVLFKILLKMCIKVSAEQKETNSSHSSAASQIQQSTKKHHTPEEKCFEFSGEPFYPQEL